MVVYQNVFYRHYLKNKIGTWIIREKLLSSLYASVFYIYASVTEMNVE